MALAPWQQTNPTWKVFGHQPNMESQWNPTGWLPQSRQVLPCYGFSFLGALAWVLFTKQFLPSWGPCGAAKYSWIFSFLGLGQKLAFLALGQTGVPGQLATTYQFANGVVGGTELQEFFGLGALQPGLQQWSLVCPLGT